MSGCLVARHHQQCEEVLELEVGQGLSVGLGGEECGDDVLAGVLTAGQGYLLGVAEHLEGRRGPEGQQPVLLGVHFVDDHRCVFGVGVGDHLVAPGNEPARIRLGYTEQTAQHPDRQFPGHLGDEVEPAELYHLVEHRSGQLPEGALVGGHHLRGEAGLDQASQPGVLRRVELHHGPPGLQLVGVHLLHPDAPCRGEAVVVPTGFDDIRMPGDSPEPRTVPLLHPCHRFLLPHPTEGGVGKPGQVGVMRGDVGVGVVGDPVDEAGSHVESRNLDAIGPFRGGTGVL